MKPTRIAGAVAATAAAAALIVPSAFAATKVDPDKIDPSLTQLNILNTNDFHGHFTKDFACTVTSAQRELPGAVFLSAGDNVGGTPFASASQNDEPALSYLNALGLKASTVGNHEFDKGFDDLRDRIQPHSDFTYLGANVYKKGTQTPALPAYTVLNIAGLRVGVVGAVTDTVPSLVSAPGIAGLDFGDPVAAVNRVAAQLKDGNPANGEADVIVAEYHEGAPAGGDVTLVADEANSPTFAAIVNKTAASVDAIFTGHTHQIYAFDGPVPGGSGTRPVVQTDFYAAYLGVLQLGHNKQTRKVEQYSFVNRQVAAPSEACASDPAYVKAAGIVDAANAKADEIGKQQIGTVTADITTAYGTDGARDDRMRESTLSNAIAQSYLDSINKPGRLGGVDIGVMNPGGVRAELLAKNDGRITYADAASIMPFNNTVQTISLTGAQFVRVLEQQWQPAGSSRPFLQLGLSDNVTYTYDPDAAAGSHINSVRIDGKALDPAASYKIASNSFLISGGDNFTEFAKGTGSADSGLIDQSLFVEWIKEHSPLSPSFVKHAVAVKGQPTSVKAGSKVSFTVSGLDLTSLGAPTTTSVQVLLGGKDLGTFAVTKGLSTAPPFPTRNESADITVTIPADATGGASELVVKAAQTGTTVTMPVTVQAAASPSPSSPSPSSSTGASPSPTGSTSSSAPVTTTGPPVVTDGGAGMGGNAGLLVGAGAAVLALGAGATLLGRRLRG